MPPLRLRLCRSNYNPLLKTMSFLGSKLFSHVPNLPCASSAGASLHHFHGTWWSKGSRCAHEALELIMPQRTSFSAPTHETDRQTCWLGKWGKIYSASHCRATLVTIVMLTDTWQLIALGKGKLMWPCVCVCVGGCFMILNGFTNLLEFLQHSIYWWLSYTLTLLHLISTRGNYPKV